MSELVYKLCGGDHAVEISLRPKPTVKALQEAIDRGYIHIKFTETKGGTELGIRLERELTRLENADLPNQSGRALLVGRLTLDYVDVRCIADIDVGTFSGVGHLEQMVHELNPKVDTAGNFTVVVKDK